MSFTQKNISPFRNAESDALAKGEIVRIGSTGDTIRRADASDPDLLLGLIGVTLVGGRPGAQVPVVLSGPAEILMEDGLTVAPREAIYVSGTVPGRGTNVAPGSAARVGWVANTTLYSSRRLVSAIATAMGLGSSSPGGGSAIISGFNIMQADLAASWMCLFPQMSAAFNLYPNIGDIPVLTTHEDADAFFNAVRMPACTLTDFRCRIRSDDTFPGGVTFSVFVDGNLEASQSSGALAPDTTVPVDIAGPVVVPANSLVSVEAAGNGAGGSGYIIGSFTAVAAVT